MNFIRGLHAYRGENLDYFFFIYSLFPSNNLAHTVLSPQLDLSLPRTESQLIILDVSSILHRIVAARPMQ